MMHEIRDVSILEPFYPSKLTELAEPPPVLSVLGQLDFDSRPVLAVIGSRHSSVQAETWMRRYLRPLSRNCVILSGGARGIDEMAHAIAIEEKQPTVVVLPSGLNRPYPKDWKSRVDLVVQNGGALLSEYAPDTEIRAWHFEKRNRLIAALADVVLVVEARSRSGTAITVRHALDLGRPVAALPWFPGDARGEYCNEILTRGGIPVRNAEDLAGVLVSEARLRMAKAKQVTT